MTEHKPLPIILEPPLPLRLHAATRARLHVELDRYLDRVLTQVARAHSMYLMDARLIGQGEGGDFLYRVELYWGDHA